jgi:DNA-binding NtrC family response regulator
MNAITLLCVDDEPEVLEAVERDLTPLEDHFPLELAASAQEAEQRIEAIIKRGDHLGVIFCDHVMPGKKGVDLLIEMAGRDETRHTRKVLLTGQAGLEATVDAVNRAQLNHYVAKPWQPEALRDIARRELTEYIISRKIDPLPYLQFLDPIRMNEALRRGTTIGNE